jgi:TPP-dependent 2-oxoacid decarboxylase
VVIRHHRYPKVLLGEFLSALAGRAPSRPRHPVIAPWPESPGFPEPGRPMTTARLVGRLNAALTAEHMVVCETGDCLFAATELRVHKGSDFFASAFYTSMGFAVPAALGAQVARPDARALILVGDGAFQMTGTELSTIARLGLDPIVIVFNNRGYSTERYILDGPFNDVAAWRFHRLGEVFGPLSACQAATEAEFEQALLAALAQRACPSLIDVQLAPEDASPAMRRLAEHLRAKI